MTRKNDARAIRSTTVLVVRHNGATVMAGDGQVTLGSTVVKHGAKKVRKLYNDKVLAGFAGSTADALYLFDRLSAKLEQYNGNLTRAAVELAKDWRTDKMLRRLEALLVAADRDAIFLLSGSGDVIEPDEGVIGIGSGGAMAQAAATALLRHSGMSAKELAEAAMSVASSLCIYTNDRFTVVEL